MMSRMGDPSRQHPGAGSGHIEETGLRREPLGRLPSQPVEPAPRRLRVVLQEAEALLPLRKRRETDVDAQHLPHPRVFRDASVHHLLQRGAGAALGPESEVGVGEVGPHAQGLDPLGGVGVHQEPVRAHRPPRCAGVSVEARSAGTDGITGSGASRGQAATSWLRMMQPRPSRIRRIRPHRRHPPARSRAAWRSGRQAGLREIEHGLHRGTGLVRSQSGALGDLPDQPSRPPRRKRKGGEPDRGHPPQHSTWYRLSHPSAAAGTLSASVTAK